MKVSLNDNLTVQIRRDDGTWIYEIDLERCRNSAELLDWLFQVLNKHWCTPQIISAVMWKIEEACRQYHHQSVQGTFCGLGIDHKVSWPKCGSNESGIYAGGT